MQKRILIVEDDNDLRDLLRIVLLEEGFQVDTCQDGKVAMQSLEAAKKDNKKPNMVILDLNMPVVDGWKVARWLDADPELKDIPVIVNTAFHKGTLIDRAIAVGAAEILHKPISFEALREVVRRYLSSNDTPDLSRSSENPQLLRSPDRTTLSAPE